MNVWQPFKLHYYAYRKFYYIFWFFTITVALGGAYIFKNYINIYYYLTVGSLISVTIYSFLTGMYEYNRLSYHYINLKTIRNEFYYSSILHSVINSLIQILGLGIIFIGFHYINKNSVNLNQIFPYNSISTYLITFIIQIFIFSLANILTLFLRNIKFIKNIVYLSLLVIFSVFFIRLTNNIIKNIYDFYFNFQLIYKIIPLSIVGIIALLFIIYFKFINSFNK